LICEKDEGNLKGNYQGVAEEYSSTVQYDSCTRWLHISCLPDANKKKVENDNWLAMDYD
jgi:hypothetical protein